MADKAGRGTDPLVGFTFSLDIDGLTAGFFNECSGLGSENEVVEHKAVDKSGHEIVQKIPGRLKFEDITLKRGITTNLELWQWRKKVEQGNLKEARVNGSVVMYDRNYEEVARWNFENGWPSKVTGPQLDAGSTDIGIEEITIVHELLVREK